MESRSSVRRARSVPPSPGDFGGVLFAVAFVVPSVALAVAIACLVGLAAAPDASAQVVTRGPYLQRGASTSITIRWRTSTPIPSQLRYGTDSGLLLLTAGEPTPVTDHSVALTGLLPATRYYYAIEHAGQVVAGGDATTYFETSPPPGSTAATRIWVIGDSGSHEPPPYAVIAAYEAFAGDVPATLWLMLGDNAYDDGTDAEYQTAVFDMFPALLRKTPVWSALGNHDGRSADSATETGPYYEIFDFPRAGEQGGVPSGTEAYYAFDHANAHFVVLDSYESNLHPEGEMRAWLEADLQDMVARDETDWLIALWHHPPYTKGFHDSDYGPIPILLRETYVSLLEAHGVDLLLTGHSHSYERSRLIDGHYGTSATFGPVHAIDGGDGDPSGDGAYVKPTFGHAPHEGAVYAVVGSSSKLAGGALNHPAMQVSLNERGSLVLDLNGSELRGHFVNEEGAVRDHFAIRKGAAQGMGIVAGIAWRDDDRDGLRDPGEERLGGIDVALRQGNGLPIATTTTDVEGGFAFGDLRAGHYRLAYAPGNLVFTHERQGPDPTRDSDASMTTGVASFTLAENETRSGLDVGLHAAEPLEEIPIDLSQTNVASYAGLDQPDGTTVFDATGASVRVTGTRWIETLSAHDIVPSSLLSFDFRSSNSGVPSAIGFDDDGDPTTGIRLLDLGGLARREGQGQGEGSQERDPHGQAFILM